MMAFTRTLLILLLCLITASAAHAQNIIRDAEIENDLRTISDPIFSAAGLNPSQVRMVLINDDAVNAFVAGGQNLFLYTGLILDSKNVDELAGVIAHESGHMAGGHLVRMRGIAERASVENIIATVLGVAVGVGAGDAQAGMATAMGGSEYARRSMLRHTRVLESSADQAGMAALSRAGYSLQGMADLLERLSSQEVLPEMQRSPYILTHPLSRERLQSVQGYVSSHPKGREFPAKWQEYFRRMKAKIMAFTSPNAALRQYKDDQSFSGRYAVAIANYRLGKIPEALALVDQLQKTEPSNGYLQELEGQILYEQGRIAESVSAYRKAVALKPNAGLIHMSLAQALLQNEKMPPDEALKHLIAARNKGEADTSQLYRSMAIAYGRMGQEGMAKLSLAEEALLKGDKNFAIEQGRRAEDLLKNDPASQQRARDIQSTALRINKK